MSNVRQILRRCTPAILAAVCLATFGAAARAQSTAMPAMEGAPGLVPSDDWRILNNPAYDYIDLKLASALGYSDSERATIAKIARLTGLPFKLILNQVHEGRTFALLASDYGLKLGDVLDSSDEQERIAKYLRLYELLASSGTYIYAKAAAIPGPTLEELEAHFNQLSASFPALPPTNIETSAIGTTVEETPAYQAPPVAAAPPPPPPAPEEAAPPAKTVYTKKVVVHTFHSVRHPRVHRRRHHKPAYMMHRGS